MFHLFDHLCSELDANGRDSTRTLVIDGKVAFHEIHTYDDDANLVREDLSMLSSSCNLLARHLSIS